MVHWSDSDCGLLKRLNQESPHKTLDQLTDDFNNQAECNMRTPIAVASKIRRLDGKQTVRMDSLIFGAPVDSFGDGRSQFCPSGRTTIQAPDPDNPEQPTSRRISPKLMSWKTTSICRTRTKMEPTRRWLRSRARTTTTSQTPLPTRYVQSLVSFKSHRAPTYVI